MFAAGIGVRWLFKGFTAHYVYERGAIQTRNRRISVATWEQLDEIQRAVAVRALFREILSVRFFDGRRWEVEAVTRQQDLDQRLVSAFLDAAGRLGRPVTQPRRRYKDEGVPAPATFQQFPDGSWVDGASLWYAEDSVSRTGVCPKQIRAVAARLADSIASAASHR